MGDRRAVAVASARDFYCVVHVVLVWCVQAGDADGDVLTVYSQRDSWVVLVVSRRSQSGRKVEASGWSPPLRTMAAFVSSVQMPVSCARWRTAGPSLLEDGALLKAPSSECQRRAESPSPGGEQARASTSITARVAQQLVPGRSDNLPFLINCCPRDDGANYRGKMNRRLRVLCAE